MKLMKNYEIHNAQVVETIRLCSDGPDIVTERTAMAKAAKNSY